MLQPTLVKDPLRVPLNKIKPDYIHQLLEPMKIHINYREEQLREGFEFKIKIRDTPRNKENPTLRLASPDDAEIITNIVKEDYEGTYPYKEMEDPQEVRNMIESGKYKFVLFLNEDNEIIGTTCFVLDLENKTGYTRTFVVKKECLGVLDSTKAYVGSFIAICNKYKDKIHLWWGEARTADAKSQYINRLCSFRPIGFLPNKDFFFNKIESDVIIACYNQKIFSQHRSSNQPKIIPQVENCYEFSNDQYKLGKAKIVDPNIDFVSLEKKANELQKFLKFSSSADKFNYINYKLTLKNSDSFFSFLYTPRVNNFEKVKYKIYSLAELFLFAKKFQQIGFKLNIRYMESYISAYKPLDQKLFYELGFNPRGYLPAWKLNKKNNKFKDYILFNWYRGSLNPIEMIDEGNRLLKCLNEF
ncbi:MAG: hypothetical protein EU547_06845 [Promethearchaeota archaeon]|nr:MAG: hypothetical protein EU547_06845 [Candidatus Lokiarchaeota archaeon]